MVEDFCDYIDDHVRLHEYFPEKREEKERLPRSFIINVLFSLVGAPIKERIQKRILERNQRLVEKQNIGLQLDDEVREAFLRSTQVNVSF